MKTHLRTLLGLLAVLALAVALGACGGDDEGDAGQGGGGGEGGGTTAEQAERRIQPVQGAAEAGTISVGSKNFTEQFILGEIYAQALEAAGYTVEKELNLGSEVVAFQALTEGEVDAYPEYTGTALTSFFDVSTTEVPKEPQQAYQAAREAYAEEGVVAYPPTPFENTYRLGLTNERAQELGVTKTSDLQGKAGDLTITGYPECRQRNDCLLGVERAYDLEFGRFLGSEAPYEVLGDQADIAFLFTTDGNLASGDYTLLEDDRSFFPPYNITFTVREEVAERLGSEGQAVIEAVQRPLTQDVMQELNSRVDIDKQEPERVAADYLRAFGFTGS